MALFLQIFGVLALIIVIAIAAFIGPIIWRFWMAMREIKSLAKSTVADAERLYAGPHDWAEANPADFPGVDLQAYEDATRRYEALGFRALGDIEDRTVSEVYPQFRTFIRSFSGADDTISGGFFAFGPFRIFDLGAEFSDGTHLCVTNAESAAAIDDPPEITKRFLPSDTPLERMLEIQMQAVRERLEANPGLSIVNCATLADAIESNHRAHDLKLRFRQRHGAITADEIKRIAGSENEAEGWLLGAAVEREGGVAPKRD